MLGKQFPTAVAIKEAARDEVLAFLHFAQEHWRKVWSTYPLELETWCAVRTGVCDQQLKCSSPHLASSHLAGPYLDRHESSRSPGCTFSDHGSW